jgi:RNA polymerase-binding transcription factor DksA
MGFRHIMKQNQRESESMTPEEAIRPLKELSTRKKMADQCDQASASDIRLYQALDTAIEALEKQIAKEPVVVTIRNVDYQKCPVCGRVLFGKEYYCASCGQRVNRGD